MGIRFTDAYKLSDFSEKEQEKAREFIAEAIKSFIYVAAEKKAQEALDQLKDRIFDGEDKIHISFEIITIGNDIITALGAARRLLLKDVKIK